MNPVNWDDKYIQYHNEKGWAKLRNNPLEVKQTVFISKLKTFRMTETLSENDFADIVKDAVMVWSKSYRDRIMTMWSNGKISISNMMFRSEKEAMEQIDFFFNIREKIINTGKK